jgi:hypothetical protein
MEGENPVEDWPLSTICWYAIFVWFGASLFSQSLYMAIYGMPYDAYIMLNSIGKFAYVIIAIEVVVWITLSVLMTLKLSDRFGFSHQKSSPNEPILPNN